MGRQIVHDDDIAFVEGWCELLLDIGLEDAPVHRGIDEKGGGKLVAAQAGGKAPEIMLSTLVFLGRISSFGRGNVEAG